MPVEQVIKSLFCRNFLVWRVVVEGRGLESRDYFIKDWIWDDERTACVRGVHGGLRRSCHRGRGRWWGVSVGRIMIQRRRSSSFTSSCDPRFGEGQLTRCQETLGQQQTQNQRDLHHNVGWWHCRMRGWKCHCSCISRCLAPKFPTKNKAKNNLKESIEPDASFDHELLYFYTFARKVDGWCHSKWASCESAKSRSLTELSG